MKQNPTKNQTGGFALVVTLSMMILLTVIAIGLLSLSSVSLRTTSNATARKIAESNARMALMLAIGELQRSAGPDQRATATANIAGDNLGYPLDAGAAPQNDKTIDNKSKSLSSVRPGTRYWTGVWTNTDVNPATSIYRKTPSVGIEAPSIEGLSPDQQKFTQWLVSGANTDPNITPASNNYEVSTSGSLPDEDTAVILVGKNSARNATSSSDPYVAAPLIPIQATVNGSTSTTGRYAWWVGDEGVKAKMNIAPTYEANAVATNKIFSTQRSGWETVENFDRYPTPGTNNKPINGLVTVQQAELLGISRDAVAEVFHSATTDSFGLLVDTLQGGLRYDLTSGLRNNLPSSAADSTILNSIVNNKNIITPQMLTTPTQVAAMKGPKWNRLKEFSEMGSTLSNGSLKVKAAANATTDYSIAPLIVDLRLLLGAKSVPAGGTDYFVKACAKIAVTLANPYSYPLECGTLDLEIKNSFNDVTEKLASVFNAPGTASYVPTRPGDPAVFSNTIFRIDVGTLAPGAAKAYSMTGPAVQPGAARITVPLAPVSSSTIGDFKNSVVLENTAKWKLDGEFYLDVRESTVTTMIDVELRPQNSALILRKLERFELDNGEYSNTARKLTASATAAPPDRRPASTTLNPFPLQLYTFQISQPGEAYQNLFANTGQMGIRASTLRTYADFNLQATHYRKTNSSYNPAPYFMRLANALNYLPFSNNAGDTGDRFTENITSPDVPWGRSSVSGSQKTILFSPPEQNEMLVSIAQFQHADLTGDNIYASVAHQPGNAVGNSYATPFVPRQSVALARNDYRILPRFDAKLETTSTNYYDISYLLNAALWDRYYFSTIPASGDPDPMNQKIVKIVGNDESSDLQDPSKAAAHLMVNGAFNINSTDKNAWKAFLAGTKHLKHPSDTTSTSDALYARSLRQISPGKAAPSGVDADSFSGFRRLNDAQLDALAEEITKQVRLRGPFVSLSQFVNRALTTLTANKALSRCGALQSALDNCITPININFGTSTASGKNALTNVNPQWDKLNVQSNGSTPIADLPGDVSSKFQPSTEWGGMTRDANAGTIVGIYADKAMVTSTPLRTEQGFRSTGIPGWLTQADVLQAIGPSITTRSDTFKIRAYGEALDKNGKVTAKAWCEATVQRTPEYVDSQNLATDAGTSLTESNKIFGRKFAVVSFRWLSQNEI